MGKKYEYWKEKVRVRREKLSKAKKRVVLYKDLVAKAIVKREHHKPRPQDKVIAWAREHIGETESPPGSNKGRNISKWQKESLGYDGFAWCGAFVGAGLRRVGVQGIHGPSIVYTPKILADARNGINGLEKVVAFDDAKKGDLVLFNFPGGEHVDHVGFVARDHEAGSAYLDTIEGNTSAGNSGSQSNGGGVFPRERHRSLVAAVVRPRYA
jgi:hypothetical protein